MDRAKTRRSELRITIWIYYQRVQRIEQEKKDLLLLHMRSQDFEKEKAKIPERGNRAR